MNAESSRGRIWVRALGRRVENTRLAGHPACALVDNYRGKRLVTIEWVFRIYTASLEVSGVEPSRISGLQEAADIAGKWMDQLLLSGFSKSDAFAKNRAGLKVLETALCTKIEAQDRNEPRLSVDRANFRRNDKTDTWFDP